MSEWKLLGVLALGVFLASMVFYAVFSLWYMPFLMVSSTTIYFIYIRLHYRNKLDKFTADLRSKLIA